MASAEPAAASEPARSGLEVLLVAHGEAETGSIRERWMVGHRTLAHAAEVMTLPAPLRWLVCLLGAVARRGSGSPHNAWTRAQAVALSQRLAAELAEPVSVQAAFAASEPSVEALIERQPSVRRRILVSMMPSDSRLSCGLLCHALANAGSAHTQVLARLWDDPEFIALNTAHVLSQIAAWPVGPASPTSTTALVLALHGTLTSDRRGRPVAFHAGLEEKAQFAGALQASLMSAADPPWSAVVPAYLNHGVGGRWTQPTVAMALESLGRQAYRRVWVFPCDYLVEGGEISGGLRHRLETGPIEDARLLPCLNDSPALIDYLAVRIRRALADPSGPWRCDACPLNA